MTKRCSSLAEFGSTNRSIGICQNRGICGGVGQEFVFARGLQDIPAQKHTGAAGEVFARQFGSMATCENQVERISSDETERKEPVFGQGRTQNHSVLLLKFSV